MHVCMRCAVALVILVGPMARADFTEIIDPSEQPLWETLVGDFTTITFMEIPPVLDLDDEYQELGVTFGGDLNTFFFTPSFVNDGVGLDGNTEVRLTFDVPITAFAMDFPGITDVAYFRDGERIPGGGAFGGGGVGFFYGFVSTVPFDEVLLFDDFGEVFIDDLYFGPPIPTPGSAALLLVAGILRRPRR